MMHKTKSAKFSLAIKIASILVCVSVMAVGFASWLILIPATDQTTDGSFTVYTVNEAQLSFDSVNLDGAVVFGKPATTNNTNWLKPSSDVLTEDLTAALTFTVNSSNDEVNLSEYADNAYVVFRPGSASVLETAMTNNVITFNVTGTATYTDSEGESQNVTINTASYDATNDKAVLSIPLTGVDATTLSVSVSFNFGWGSHFTPAEADAPVNPYTYYNGLSTSYNATYAADATEYLGYISALSGLGYKVFVSLDANANTNN